MHYQTLDIFPLLTKMSFTFIVFRCVCRGTNCIHNPCQFKTARLKHCWEAFDITKHKRHPKALWTINLYEPEERLLPLFFHDYCEVKLFEEASILLEACPSDYDMPCTVYAYQHYTCSLCHSIGFSWSSSFWTAIHLIWTVKPDTNQYNVKK